MKHILTISLCFLALSLSAQEPDGLCCDPDGTNYTALNCLTSGCCGIYGSPDGCIEDPDCDNYNSLINCDSLLCDGQLDLCGVCNGPGAVYECGCADIPVGDCDCFGNELDACGECGGDSGCLFCGEGTSWDPDAQTCVIDDSLCAWQPDGNADGLIGVEDLLDLLAVYGDTDLDSDGVWDSIDDCLDLEACNYAANPTEPCGYIDALGECGGGCGADTDGDYICDDIDDCIGVVDECGVCNGPGPTEVVIEVITLLYDSVYLPQLEEWYVYEYGADTTYTYECPPLYESCGDIQYQGYTYNTVQIGTQCWFKENLHTSFYRNGDGIPNLQVNEEWSNTTTSEEGAWANYDNDESLEIDFGKLYNWYAVNDNRDLCPSEWHVPTFNEWSVLTTFLGGDSIAGDAMKDDIEWNGSNASGFSMLPGGLRYNHGGYDYFGGYGYCWSSSAAPGNGSHSVGLDYSQNSVFRFEGHRRNGFSVRCIKD